MHHDVRRAKRLCRDLGPPKRSARPGPPHRPQPPPARPARRTSLANCLRPPCDAHDACAPAAPAHPPRGGQGRNWRRSHRPPGPLNRRRNKVSHRRRGGTPRSGKYFFSRMSAVRAWPSMPSSRAIRAVASAMGFERLARGPLPGHDLHVFVDAQAARIAGRAGGGQHVVRARGLVTKGHRGFFAQKQRAIAGQPVEPPIQILRLARSGVRARSRRRSRPFPRGRRKGSPRHSRARRRWRCPCSPPGRSVDMLGHQRHDLFGQIGR